MSRPGAIISQTGTPLERGLEHGRALGPLIRDVIADICPASWADDANIQHRLERQLDALVRYAGPTHLEEMVGIALGSGASFEEIARLNLILGSDGIPGVESPSAMYLPACTALALVDPALGAVCGKNGDAELHQAAYYWIRRVDTDDLRYLDVVWPGTIWTDSGINEHGLAIVQTGGPGLLEQGPGLAGCVLPRVVLEAATCVAEALDLLHELPASGFGLTYVLADRSGHTAIVEKVHRRTIVRATGCFGWAVNRFEEPAMQADLVPIPLDGLDESNDLRCAALRQIETESPQTRAELCEILRRPPIFQQGAGGLYSVSTVAYTPSELSLLVTDERLDSPFRRVTLDAPEPAGAAA